MRRGPLLIGLLLAIVLLSFVARDRALWFVLGLLVLAVLAVALTFIPWRPPAWRPMPDLFVRPAANQGWCIGCGRPQQMPCPSCGPAKNKRQAPNSRKSVRKRA